MTQTVKVVEATQVHTKVWNVTDWPGKGHKLQSFILFGRTVFPGKSVKVPVDDLQGSLLKKLVDQGFLYVGQQAPVEYLTVKGKVLARAPREATRTHGDTPELKQRREMRKAGELSTPAVREEGKTQGTQGQAEEGAASGDQTAKKAPETSKRRNLRDRKTQG